MYYRPWTCINDEINQRCRSAPITNKIRLLIGINKFYFVYNAVIFHVKSFCCLEEMNIMTFNEDYMDDVVQFDVVNLLDEVNLMTVMHGRN